MSDFPIALHGERIIAVVVGGGAVGTRKARALVEAGAQVRVVAPVASSELEEAERLRQITLVREAYRREHLDRATLVIAATDSREINAQIAIDANAARRLEIRPIRRPDLADRVPVLAERLGLAGTQRQRRRTDNGVKAGKSG